jgi:hypothetical protein
MTHDQTGTPPDLSKTAPTGYGAPPPYGTTGYGAPQPPYGAPAPGAGGPAGHPGAVRPAGGTAVTVVLTVVAVVLAPIGYLLTAWGTNERYTALVRFAQGNGEAAIPTIALLLGLVALGAVALLAGRAPLGALLSGAWLLLAGLHGLVDPLGAYRLVMDVFPYALANGVAQMTAISGQLIIGALLLGAGAAGALGRRRGRREALAPR